MKLLLRDISKRVHMDITSLLKSYNILDVPVYRTWYGVRYVLSEDLEKYYHRVLLK